MRVCDLAAHGHAEAKTFLERNIAKFDAKYIDKLHKQGYFEDILKLLNVPQLIILYGRTDLVADADSIEDSPEAIIRSLLNLAESGNTEARDELH